MPAKSFKIRKTPRIEWVGGKRPWKVTSEGQFRPKRLGKTIVVPAGYCTNLASVPRLPLIYLIAGGRASVPAVFHDYLYDKLCPYNLTRKECDLVFLDCMQALKDPKSSIKRKLMYWGVRIGARWAFRRETNLLGEHHEQN